MIGTDPKRPKEESGSPRQVSRRTSPCGFRSALENVFGVTFRSISAVYVPIYDFSVHCAHSLPCEQRHSLNSLNDHDQVP